MRVSVFGCGYLGAVHAACLAHLGHEVVGVEVLPERVESLRRGEPPFFEPGLAELLDQTLSTGRLGFSTDAADAAGATVHFVCVGTPSQPYGDAADLSDVRGAIESLVGVLGPEDTVVGKSTVPVGTAEELRARVQQVRPGAELVWNPEFLREGFAVQDTLTPDRLVYGVAESTTGRAAAGRLDGVYADLLAGGTPRVVTDLATAQLVKVAANTFLATKISFINAMADLCDAAGGDVGVLAEALGHDPRIGRLALNPGIGYGGGCLPKDIRAFVARAGELGVSSAVGLLGEVDAINTGRRAQMVDLARLACGGSLRGRRVAVLGAAFKAGSDDVRESPALAIASGMRQQGATVTVTDPQALDNARRQHPELCYAATVTEGVADADVVLVLTEWPEYVRLDPAELAPLVTGGVIVDGRHCLPADDWRRAGWSYHAPGLGSLGASHAMGPAAGDLPWSHPSPGDGPDPSATRPEGGSS